MNKIIEKRILDKNQRVPTVAKVRRDGLNMYQYARYVIVLDKSGNIEEVIDRNITFLGDYLVVLSPIVYLGTPISLSVVLEIALSRSVPYQPFEKRIAGKVVTVTNRLPVARMSTYTLKHVMPRISKALSNIVEERVGLWKTKKFFLKAIWKEKQNGIFITIDTSEELLCYSSFLRDIETRHYLRRTATVITYFLKNYKKRNYSKKMLRKMKGTRAAVELLTQAKYPKHYLAKILSYLSKETRRVLCESLQAVLKRDSDLNEYTIEELLRPSPPSRLFISLDKKLRKQKIELIKFWKVGCILHPRRDNNRSLHAKNCLRFEVVTRYIETTP